MMWALLALVPAAQAVGNRTYVRACYLSVNLPVENIPADLCTHLLAVFGTVTPEGGIDVSAEDEARLSNLTSLRDTSPRLKVLLTVKGPSDNFAAAAASNTSRVQFTDSAVARLTAFNLDGLDINWEFPAFPPWQRQRRERHDQTLLLQALSAALHDMSPRRLLTVAAGAPPTVVSTSYEVPAVAAAADYVSIMTYDLHFYQTITPFTGHNAPLYANSWEEGYFAKLNTASVAGSWLSKGLPAEKMLVGIPTYGRSWQLKSRWRNQVGDVSLGPYGNDFPSFVTVCNLLRNGGTRRWDQEAMVPYAFKGRQWISYDDQTSVEAKTELVKSLDAAGAMVFILDSDDWDNQCGEGEFPLTSVVKANLP